jgi:hypothetical protein
MVEEDYDIIQMFDATYLRLFLGLKGLESKTTPFYERGL